MAGFPRPEEGIVLTHFIITSDVARSRRFYADVANSTACSQAGITRGARSGRVRATRSRRHRACIQTCSI